MVSTLTFKAQAVRYALVGLANTVITAIVIFSFMYTGVGVYVSNAVGYVAGIILSFLANTVFTFSTNLSPMRFAKFLLTCLGCWLLNVLTIKLFLMVFTSQLYISQIIGMGVYTATGFIINKLWVMK